MKRLVLVSAFLLLLLPSATHAKGTNVRISSAPNGTDAGEPWKPLITVTMPGNGRLAGVRPRVISRRGVMRRSFAARPTGRRGVYRARVVFPSRGRWRYGIHDGFDRLERGAGQVHGFPPVRIAPDEPRLAEAPLPISGEIEVQGASQPGYGPGGSLPPETFSPPAGGADDGGGWRTGLIAGAALAMIAAAAALIRRRTRRRSLTRTPSRA